MSSSVVSLVKNIPEKVIFAKKFLKVNVIIHSFRESNAKFRDYDGFDMVLTIFKLEYKWQKSQQSCKLHKKNLGVVACFHGVPISSQIKIEIFISNYVCLPLIYA